LGVRRSDPLVSVPRLLAADIDVVGLSNRCLSSGDVNSALLSLPALACLPDLADAGDALTAACVTIVGKLLAITAVSEAQLQSSFQACLRICPDVGAVAAVAEAALLTFLRSATGAQAAVRATFLLRLPELAPILVQPNAAETGASGPLDRPYNMCSIFAGVATSPPLRLRALEHRPPPPSPQQLRLLCDTLTELLIALSPRTPAASRPPRAAPAICSVALFRATAHIVSAKPGSGTHLAQSIFPSFWSAAVDLARLCFAHKAYCLAFALAAAFVNADAKAPHVTAATASTASFVAEARASFDAIAAQMEFKELKRCDELSTEVKNGSV
jgi:hypothetical protein